MINTERWEAECQLMAHYCPEFEPFVSKDDFVGFARTITGKRSGNIYEVVIMLPNRHE